VVITVAKKWKILGLKITKFPVLVDEQHPQILTVQPILVLSKTFFESGSHLEYET
jgi:hypothetical protein